MADNRASDEAYLKAKERLSKGQAEGKTPTDILMESINELGETYGAQILKEQKRTNELEDRLDRYEARKGTSFGNANTRIGIRDQISNVLGQNAEGIKGLLEGSSVNTFRMETKTVGDISIGANLTGGTASINSPVLGPVGMAYRINNVQDLLRQTTMTGNKIPVLRDNGGEGVPTPVAEGGDKPSVDFDLLESDAKAETIAATTIVTKQFLEDIPNAQNWLSDRLTELWQAAFNDQVLNGNGTSPNFKGLNTAGNFTAASGLATINIEQLIQAILQMRILKRRPSGIIVNPASLESLILNKATGGSEEYDLPNVVTVNNVGQLMVMGVPLVDIAEQPAGTFTLHDNTGSLLAWRNGLTIEFFSEIYAKTNKILIRIEARAAFPVYGSSYTIKGSF